MAFKKQSTSTTAVGGPGSKKYFWRSAEFGNGMSEWTYVTPDAPTAVEVSGYFDDAELLANLKVGDRIWVYQVGAIDDTRTVQADIAAGFADLSLHAVVNADTAAINVTPDLLTATVTYTS